MVNLWQIWLTKLRQFLKYVYKKHTKLQVGDLVLIKDQFVKPMSYPMAIVTKVCTNDLQEVTAAEVRKGSTREILKRHVSSLIPLLQRYEYCSCADSIPKVQQTPESEQILPMEVINPEVRSRPRRGAAMQCLSRVREVLNYEDELSS